MESSIGTLQDIVENQPTLKKSLQHVVDTEKDIFDQGMEQVSEVAKYVKANWKIVVPALAALGVGAFLLRGQSKKLN